MSPREPHPGERLGDDPTPADEEVVHTPSDDNDQGRETQERKEAPEQQKQIFPDN